MRIPVFVFLSLFVFVSALSAQSNCVVSATPSDPSIDASEQQVSASVVTSDPHCNVVLTGGASWIQPLSITAAGSQTIHFLIEENSAGIERSATYAVGGQHLRITQRGTYATFADVPPAAFYFDGANRMRHYSITDGCAAAPLRYCPNNLISRGEMAVFLVRTILGGDDFRYELEPYFDDVAASHPFFRWIQKLKELQVTSGCAARRYCPGDTVTRGQMAVFVIRARYGATTAFQHPAAAYFADVPPAHPFYPWIQQLKRREITSGCAAGSYCPEAAVTRGQMAIFLIRAGFNELMPPGRPRFMSIDPASAFQDSVVSVIVQSRDVDYDSSGAAWSLGEGVSVRQIQTSGGTTGNAQLELTIAAGAPPGPRSVIYVNNSDEEAVLPNRFTVFGVRDTLRPTLSAVSPPSGELDVPINAIVELRFSERMNNADLNSSQIYLSTADGLDIAATVETDADGKTVRLKPQSLLPLATELYLHLDSLHDRAGNEFSQYGYPPRFTTGFGPSADVFEIVATAPGNGGLLGPSDSVFVRFSEFPNVVRAPSALRILRNGQPVPGIWNSRYADHHSLEFSPAGGFIQDATYELRADAHCESVTGVQLGVPFSSQFTVGGTSSNHYSFAVSSLRPYNGDRSAPVNSIIEIGFTQVLDPGTVIPSNIGVLDAAQHAVPAQLQILPAGQRVQLIPLSPLQPLTRYELAISPLLTSAGGDVLSNGYSAQFTTTAETDTAAPVITSSSPADGATGIPVNASIGLLLSENILQGAGTAPVLSLRAGSTPIAGRAYAGGLYAAFEPAAVLQADTLYTWTLDNYRDYAGNLGPAVTGSFRTAPSAAADTTPPMLTQTDPAAGQEGVPLGQVITLTFSEALAASNNLDSDFILYRIDGNASYFQTSAKRIVGNQVIITPTTPLVGNAEYSLSHRYRGVSDLAGNFAEPFVVRFRTVTTSDNTRPRVLTTAPASGAAGVNPGQVVQLELSESIDPSSMASSIGLFANGAQIETTYGYSLDAKTLFLYGALPPEAEIAVTVSTGLRALTGNAAEPFHTSFTTAPLSDSAGLAPEVTSATPQGYYDVSQTSPITLFLSSPVDPSTVNSGVVVVEDGQLLPGTLTIRLGGRAIEYVPQRPFAPAASVLVRLAPSVRDIYGRPFGEYRRPLRIDGQSAAELGAVLGSPGYNQRLSGRASYGYRFDRPLDPSSVTASAISLRFEQTDLPFTFSLADGNRVLQIVPNAPLPHSKYVQLRIEGIRGVRGETLRYDAIGDNATTAAETDTVAPVVTEAAPPDGSNAISTNARVHVAFSEVLNAITVNADTVQLDGGGRTVPASFAIMGDGAQIELAPLIRLDPSTLYTLSVNGVQDLGGNTATPFTLQFRTDQEADLTPPHLLSASPGAKSLAGVNSTLSFVFDEPIDNFFLNANSVYVERSFSSGYDLEWPGALQLSSGGMVLTYTPNEPFPINATMSVHLNASVTDLAGNRLEPCTGCPPLRYEFRLSGAADLSRPVLVTASPNDQTGPAPINTRVSLKFSEPLAAESIRNFTLSSPTGLVPFVVQSELGGAGVSLIPTVPLKPLRQYTVRASGLTDAAGNQFAGQLVHQFMTGDTGDISRPSIEAVSPSGLLPVAGTGAVVTVRFNEALDPLSIVPGIFKVSTAGGPYEGVAGSFELSGDGRAVIFTPRQPLLPNRTYSFSSQGGWRDLSGQSDARWTQVSATFRTLPGADAEPPSVLQTVPASGSGGIVLNAGIHIEFSEPLYLAGALDSVFQVRRGANLVAGYVSADPAANVLSFWPRSFFDRNDSVTVQIAGYRDSSGNAGAPLSFNFTTVGQEVIDLAPPRLLSLTPSGGSTGVSPNTAIVAAFDEPVDPTSVNNKTFSVSADAFTTLLPGAYSVSGAVATFTPTGGALPPNAQIGVRFAARGIRDTAGNALVDAFGAAFSTSAGGGDSSAPTVTSINPPDGASGPPVSPIIVTFSEAMDFESVRNAVQLFADGLPINAPLSFELDGRTLFVNASAAGAVQLLISPVARDLAGNPLEPFSAAFQFEQPASYASVLDTWPQLDRYNLDPHQPIHIWLSDPVDPATLAAGVQVSHDQGPDPTVELLSGGYVIRVSRSSGWTRGRSINVWLENSLRTLDGRMYSSTSRVEYYLPPLDGTQFTRWSLQETEANVPRNPRLEIQYSGPLNPASLGAVRLQNYSTGSAVSVSAALTNGGTTVRVTPHAALLPGWYGLYLYGLEDAAGGAMQSRSFSFTVEDRYDITPPAVIGSSPPSGATGVARNGSVFLKLTEPANLVRYAPPFIEWRGPGGVEVPFDVAIHEQFVRLAARTPLESASQYTLQFTGLEDIAGNPLPQSSIQFTTGAEVDVERPRLARSSPESGESNVPTNAAINVVFSEPIDPTLLSGRLFTYAFDGLEIAGVTALEADGKTVSFIPSTPLPVGSSVGFDLDGVYDLAGNAPDGYSGTVSLAFSTRFDADTQGPVTQSRTPAAGQSGVGANAQIAIHFDEPVLPLSGPLVTLTRGSSDVPGVSWMAADRRTIFFQPSQFLTANAVHRVRTAALRDTAGNTSPAVDYTFSTGAAVQSEPISILSWSPAENSPRNAVVEVLLASPISASELHSDSFVVRYDSGPGHVVPGTRSLSLGGRLIRFTPAEPYEYGRHDAYFAAGLSHLRNGYGQSGFTFYIYSPDDADAPTVTSFGPLDESVNVPVNASPAVLVDEMLAPTSLREGAFTLAGPSGFVPGTIAGASSGLIYFRPSTLLAPGARYTARLAGAYDLAGNALSAISFDFTTAANGLIDLEPPVLLSTQPQPGAVGVPVDAPIELRFSEQMHPSSIAAIQLLDDGPCCSSDDPPAPGVWAIEGTKIVFRPAGLLRPNRSYRFSTNYGALVDLGGNRVYVANFSFTTGQTADASRPVLLSHLPADGATGVATTTEVVLRFNEPVFPSPLSESAFLVTVNGEATARGARYSTDSRTAVIYGGWPADSTVVVEVTGGLADAAGNPAAPAQFHFVTGSEPEGPEAPPQFELTKTLPADSWRRLPVDGAISWFFSEPFDPATLPDAVFVAQDGVLVPGVLNPYPGNQALVFTPNSPLLPGRELRTWVTTALRSAAGAPLAYEYVRSFDTSQFDPNAAPYVVASAPEDPNAGPNGSIEVTFSHPLNAATVNSSNVTLSLSSTVIAGAVSLSADGLTVRFKPNFLLSSSNSYRLQISAAVLGQNGQPISFAYSKSFRFTGPIDFSPPQLVSSAPSAGSTGVGINALIRVRFDELIRNTTLTSSNVLLSTSGQSPVPVSLSLDYQRKELTIAPGIPLLPNRTYGLTLTGIADPTGNVMPQQAISFTTGPSPDFVRPSVVAAQPYIGYNAFLPSDPQFQLSFSEPIDPDSLTNESTWRLRRDRYGDIVPAVRSVSADGRQATMVPAQLLEEGVAYRMEFYTGDIRDLAANQLNFCQSGIPCAGDFIVSPGGAGIAPKILHLTPGANWTSVPRNARVHVIFDEPIDPDQLGQVQLRKGSLVIPASIGTVDAFRGLIIKPLQPLDPGATYQVVLAGVRDLAQNQTPQITSEFSTSAALVNTPPVLLSSTPANGDLGVSIFEPITLQFDQALDAGMLTPQIVRINDHSGARPFTARFEDDGKRVVVQPEEWLERGASYQILVGPVVGANGVAQSLAVINFNTAEP